MKQFFFLAALAFTVSSGMANNVVISNVSIINTGLNGSTSADIQVEFDLSWDNSWRTDLGTNNNDGVWVFFKYKQANGNWTHLTLTGNDNVMPFGAEVYQTNDFQKAGAMIFRSIDGVGSVNFTNIRLGAIATLPYDIDVKGFAIEMVYISRPLTRPFFGDGDGANESLNAFHYIDNTATNGSVVPMKTDNNSLDDSALNVGGIYVYSNDTIQTASPLGSLDPFPTMKGHWCMKYEISQAGYRDFLNTLTFNQQVARTAVSPGSATGTRALAPAGASPLPYRNYIEIATNGINSYKPAVYGCDADGDNIFDEANDGEWIACNYLSWPDVAAYLDWSGLAPMSEVLYERICRGSTTAGPQPASYQERAWGSDTIFAGTYTMSNASTANEAITNASLLAGNANYFVTSSGIQGPVRNGIFATASSDRISSGASMFGVMEMSGNLYEYCITIGNKAGRSCRFVPNGNGTISDAGNAKLSVGGAGFWPGMEGNASSSVANTCSGTCEVTGNAGTMHRGGSWGNTATSIAIAYRSTAVPGAATRDQYHGGRGVLYIR